MNPSPSFSTQRCQKNLEQFIQFDDKNTQPERWRGDKYAAIQEFFESVSVKNARMKHYTPIAGKLQSNNTVLQNLQSMDFCIEVYAMLKFHIRISRYLTTVNLPVLIINIMLQELMSIRNI